MSSYTNTSSRQSNKNTSNSDESYWYKHVKLKQSSGLGRTEYCRKNNLKCHQLEYWERKFKTAENSSHLLPIKIIEHNELAVDPRVPKQHSVNKVLCKFKLANGTVIKIYDASVLSIVLKALD